MVIHVHDQNRVLAFQRWIPGEGRDVIVGASFEQEHEVRLRNRLPGFWREVFNSDVYSNENFSWQSRLSP